MAKIPCIPQARIFTLKDTGETMSYDQVREYLMSNPELWSGKGEQKAGPLSSVEATAKALEGIIENNPVEFTERPDGKVEIVGGVVKLQLAAQKGDKKNSITKPSKISFLPNKIVLAHLAKSKADKKGILKDGFDAKRVNIDSPIPGIYFSSEDWSTVGRFDRSKENSLFVEIENDGLLYFDSSSDFRNYLKENSLPYQGETLSKEQLDFLKQKGVKGVVLREDFASQSKNELIVIDDSIIKDISESEKPITKLPSSFSEPQSISEAYHAAKKDGTNPELVKAVENLLGGEQKAEAANTPESIAARIRNKKQKGALSAIDFGISVTIYNGALEFMASQVEKGTKLGNAIANTIKWIDDKMKGEKWNKGAFEKAFRGSPEVKPVTEVPIGKPIKKTETDLLVRARPNDILNNLNRYSLKELVTLLTQHDREGEYQQLLDTEEYPNKSEALAEARKDVARIFEDFDLFELQQRQSWMDLTQTEEAVSPFAITEASKKKIGKAKAKELTRQEIELISEEKRMGTKIVPGLKFENIEGQKFEVVDVNRSTGDVTFKNVSDYEGYWRGTNTTNPMKNNYFDYLFYQVSEPLSPEQELKQAFDKWKRETGKLGIVPNWERQIQADIDLFNAAKKYLLLKIEKGAYAFEQFLKDLAKAKVENIDEDRSKWKKFYNDTIKEAASAGKEAGTPPPPVTPPAAGREMPEGEEKETEKPILGRAFRGTTDEAIAEKIVQMGLYRTPANIAEAFEIGQELVSTLGTDKAIELGTKGEVPNGLVRIGILKAVLADINKQRDALKIGEGAKGEEIYMNSLDELNDKYAQALAAFSPSLTESGQVLRAWQEVVQSAEFEFDYEGRKTRYKTLFGDEAYTEEVDERFKEYDRKIKQANKEKQELQEKIDRLEAQGIVDNIEAQKKPAPSFFKQAAERVRKLKLSRPGIFSAATPASLAWDATIEAVAVVLEASGTIEEAIAAGVKKLKTTSWYKSLTDDKKKEAEEQFSSNVKDTYIVKATVDEKGKIQIPSGLLRSYVTSGVKDANAIIDDILSYLKEANPDIIDADVRAAILEVGRKEAPKSAEITKNVNTLKTIIRMIGQLEQVQQGKRIAKGEDKQREMDNTVKSLKKQIEQFHIQQFGVKPGALTDEQRLANIKKNALNRIADMKAMQPRPEPRERVKWDAEMSRIANEEFRLKEKWNEEFKEAERKKEGAMKKFFRGSFLAVNFSKTIMTGIGDLGVLLIQGSVLPFRSASVTKEAIANMGRAFLSQEAYVEQLRKINESELYRVIRKSGLDLPQITSLEIERVEEATLGALGETIFDVMFLPFKYVPKIGPKMYEWAKNHINPARVFNRTQTSYMNTLRYGSFALSAQNLMEKGITYEDNPKSYKDVAAMINTMTGRTRVIGEESAAVMRGLNLVFYSPKNWASVIKMFTPVVLYHVGKRRADSVGVLGMSEAQQTFIRTYASFVATSAALMFLIKAISDSEDEDEEKKRETGNVSVDWENPQSAAFNKIRIGNQIFDPWGGKQQIITLQARMMIHFMGGRAFKDPYTGIEKTLEETPRFKHPLGLMSEYAKGKFSPYMSAAVKLLSSQEAKGREWYVRRPAEGGPTFNLLDPVSESYTNITYNAVDDLYSNQPLTISEVMTLFLIAGGGINTLNDQEAKTIVSQIREQVNPGEDEKRKYAANMASRLKEGDVEGAAVVYDEAMGIKGITDKRRAVKLRRDGGDKMYESASKDIVAQRYGVDDMFRKYLLQVVYENKPVAVSSSMSAKKKQVLDALNSLTPEQKQEVKLDYEYRYEELMNVVKGIDKLTSQPNKYEKRAAREYWVRQYKKATGKK